MLRRTKIVVTLGPSTDDEQVLHQLLEAGVDAFRINMSHGNLDQSCHRIRMARNAREALGKEVAIFADLQGPKMRLGCFVDQKVTLNEGDTFILDLDCPKDAGTEKSVWFDCEALIQGSTTGTVLLLDDGKMHLKVTACTDRKIYTTVLTEGVLSDRKGINISGGGVHMAAFTSKDQDDARKSCEIGVDYIAVSFPASADDLLAVRQFVDGIDPSVGLIAKIERKDAMDCLNDIIAVSDMVMVARGDLALEVGDAEVPVLQKYIIKKGNEMAKPVIVATHMMESMITSPMPTRAEVSDVANAILDGTDAVMLSAETACGDHPIAVVKHVDAICKRIEQHPNMHRPSYIERYDYVSSRQAVAYAAVSLANTLDVKCIVALTLTGTSPCWLSRICSGIPIYAFTQSSRVRAKMALFRDVYPTRFLDESEMADVRPLVAVVKKLWEEKIVLEGDMVLMIHGEGASMQPVSDLLHIHKIQKMEAYVC